MAEFPLSVIWGKFYPLHRGHQFLIETALGRSDRLVILLSYRDGETIPQAVRAKWLRELYPTAETVELPHDLPYTPDETPTPHDFYAIWKDACLRACHGRTPDAAFTSEPSYAHFTERYLGARHVLVDPSRTAVPVSGTAVRADPLATWDHLHPVVRAHFVRTVCLYGPESTGKSTLAENLAAHYHTAWQPEWARDYLGDRHCAVEDMDVIAEGHYAARERHKRRANKLLFVDTDTITTAIFSQHYYGHVPPRVQEIIARPDNRNDLYLLLAPDVPWVPDTSRDLGAPEVRTRLHAEYRRQLESRGLPYVDVTGSWDDRFRQATAAIDRLLRS